MELCDHLRESTDDWSIIPLPEEFSKIPPNPFEGMDTDDLLSLPPQLIAHVIRTRASGGRQVVSPRATPMLAIVERVDPFVRNPDHLIASTQASAMDDWPTSDGRDMSWMFPGMPNRSAVADSPQVLTSKTRPIAPQSTEVRFANPISKAIVKAASLIDVQRRSDVRGDAAQLAAVLDTAWGLPAGTFGAFAPVVACGTADLLRTAIVSDNNHPDALMPIECKKFVGVHGGLQDRQMYGVSVAMDWARQRAVARTVFYRSMKLEGVDFYPTAETWPAGHLTAPLHTSQRVKHLVFQPKYGSTFYVGPDSFRFEFPRNPPPRFAACVDPPRPRVIVTTEELDAVAADLVSSGLPEAAARAVVRVLKTHVVRKIVIGEQNMNRVRLPGIQATTIEAPSKGALISAVAKFKGHLSMKLSRGANAHRAIRSHILQIMTSGDGSDLAEVMYTISELKKHATAFDMRTLTKDTLVHMSQRVATVISSNLMHSLGTEAARMGHTLEEWFAAAIGVMPAAFRPEVADRLGWSMFMVYCMWTDMNARWVGALKGAKHIYLRNLRQNSVRTATTAHMYFDTRDERVAKAVYAVVDQCKLTYASYYEAMYDLFEIAKRHSPVASAARSAARAAAVAKKAATAAAAATAATRAHAEASAAASRARSVTFSAAPATDIYTASATLFGGEDSESESDESESEEEEWSAGDSESDRSTDSADRVNRPGVLGGRHEVVKIAATGFRARALTDLVRTPVKDLGYLNLGALCWEFRGKFLKTLKGCVVLRNAQAPTGFMNAVTLNSATYGFTPAPFKAYARFRAAVARLAHLPGLIQLPKISSGNLLVELKKIEGAFVDLRCVPRAFSETRLCRYLAGPALLAAAIETTLGYVCADIMVAAVETYSNTPMEAAELVNQEDTRPAYERDEDAAVLDVGTTGTLMQAESVGVIELRSEAVIDALVATSADGASAAKPKTGWNHMSAYGDAADDLLEDLTNMLGEDEADSFLAATYASASAFQDAVEEVLGPEETQAVSESGETAALIVPR